MKQVRSALSLSAAAQMLAASESAMELSGHEHEYGDVRCAAFMFVTTSRQPPAMAGMMLISSPLLTGVC